MPLCFSPVLIFMLVSQSQPWLVRTIISAIITSDTKFFLQKQFSIIVKLILPSINLADLKWNEKVMWWSLLGLAKMLVNSYISKWIPLKKTTSSFPRLNHASVAANIWNLFLHPQTACSHGFLFSNLLLFSYLYLNGLRNKNINKIKLFSHLITIKSLIK